MQIILTFYGTSLNCVQAEELQKALAAKNVPAKVYVGMRYWHPFTEEAIEEVLFQFWLFNSTQEMQWIFFFSFEDIYNLTYP